MMNYYNVGNVLSIDGLRITIIMRQNTNMLSYFYNGQTYRGVNIGEYVGIIRGPYKIVARVEKEYLSDRLKNINDQTYSLNRFERRIEVSVIGSFFKEKFTFGIKCLPMIFNEVVLLNENEISSIIGNGLNKNNENIFIYIGNSIQENIEINIPINGLFNSHIGIFGNTGSGKSNTLTKIYTELFNNKKLNFVNSKFVVLDFNGEYTSKNIFIDEEKKDIIKLSTRKDSNEKIKLNPKNFWNKENLSILFSATEKTQQPFIKKMLEYFFCSRSDNEFDVDEKIIKKAVLDAFKNVFFSNEHKESLNLLRKIYELTKIDSEIIKATPFYNANWNSTKSEYWFEGNFITYEEKDKEYNNMSDFLDSNFEICKLTIIDKLEILVYSQLIYGLAYNNFQFEHINPLISRIEGMRALIEKTILLENNNESKLLTIISFKDCNQDAKKILPLLISKQLYNEHIKHSNNGDEITKTCHLIVDEAHNILSEQSIREAESFKDHRLEVFEQIIKEGRKFGFYLTISSQRPYDISPTIISQLHNYFIHRLVNDMDLKMLSHTVTTLDNLSKDRIPNLSPGQCILTGTLFDLPLLIQIKKLDKIKSPNSDNADILSLWRAN